MAEAAATFGRLAEKHPNSQLVAQALYYKAASLAQAKKFAEARKLMTELTDLPVLVLNRLEPRQTYYAKAKAFLGPISLPLSTYFSFFLSPFDFETDWVFRPFRYQ